MEADARVRALGEGQVRSGVRPRDVEGVRVGERGRVAVRGSQRHDHEVARPDLRAAQFAIGGRVAVDPARGGLEAQRLLDGVRGQRGIRRDRRPLIPVGQQVPEQAGGHALAGLDPTEHHDRGVGHHLVRGQRGSRAGQHARTVLDRPADVAGEGIHRRPRIRADLAADRDAIDRGHDLVVPTKEHAGFRIPEPERTGHHVHRERPGEVAPDLGLAVRRQGFDQPACLELDGVGVAVGHLGLAQAPGERIAVASVLVAVERQHARTDDLRRGEPGIVDREAGCVAHHLDAQVPARDQPAVEDRHPRDGLVLAQAR